MSGINRIYKHESTQYTTVPNWVVRDPNYTPNTFRLLAYLLSHQSGYELTYQQIERQTTLGRFAINQAAKFLIAEGWLEWHQEKGPDGKYLAKTWIIKDPARSAIEPLHNDSTTELFRNGTINGHKEEQVIEKNTSKEKNTNYSQEFDDFWSQYPIKDGKKPAFKAFQSARKRAEYSDLIAGLLRYKTSDKVAKGYIMAASRWLNEDHWEDEYLPAPGTVADERSQIRKQKERQASERFLAEQRQLEQQAAPAPKCPHGNNVALCKKCLG